MSVVRNDARHRFEAVVDGHTAFLNYRERDGTITLIHTDVPAELEGRGLGSDIARAALAYARENDLTVIPECEFVRSFLDRHPDEAADIKIDMSSLS